MTIPEELSSIVPCRNREITQLLNLFGDGEERIPASLFLCGLKSSGKSYSAIKVLQYLKIHHAQVDCVEGYLPRLLFESIICQLFGDHYAEAKCEDMLGFINILNRAAENRMFSSRKNVIILERSERLLDMSPNILPSFARLRELCSLKQVCVVFTSSIVWEKFIPPGGLPPPAHTIFFGQYSQAEAVEILALEEVPGYSADFYRQFLSYLVAVFFKYCCDVRELRYKAKMIFPKYCEPINAGTLQMHESAALYKNVTPVFKSAIQTLYLRVDMEKKPDTECRGSYADPLGKQLTLTPSANLALSFELPFYAKFLLIAAFLASYNSPKEDKKIFVKHSNKGRKRNLQNNKRSKVEANALMMGPKQFDFERLLAIFFSIVEDKPRISVNLLSQVSSLVELQLLSKVGTDPVESPKYKCVVGLDFILNISKTVGFALTKYLMCYN